jgi:PIN domain nuclease of toxin-antitoxin system
VVLFGFIRSAWNTSIQPGLPPHHRDPFDRMLIAQAIHDDLTIVSGDHLIPLYPVSCLWE